MKTKFLIKIGDYNNFNFGLITSKYTFEKYSKLKHDKKN